MGKCNQSTTFSPEEVPHDHQVPPSDSSAQAVVAAVSAVEDGFTIELSNPCIALADAMPPMLKGGGRG